MKTSTPLLSVVQRQHAEDDKRDLARGFDPYNSRARRAVDPAARRAAQQHEASEILACYETELTLADPSASKSASGAIQE